MAISPIIRLWIKNTRKPFVPGVNENLIHARDAINQALCRKLGKERANYD